MIKYKIDKTEPLNLIDNVDAGDLQSVVTEMDTLFKEIVEARSKIKANRALIKDKMFSYDKARVEKFKKWLENNGRGWCKLCDAVPDAHDIKLLYVEHLRTTSEGYDCGLDFSELIPACSNCYIKFCNTEIPPREDYGNRIHFYRAEWQVDKYIFVVTKKATLDPGGVYKPIDANTKIIFLPDKISPKLSRSVGLAPCIELVEVGGISSKNAHLAPYIDVAEEDYFIVNDLVLLKVIDEDDEIK